MVILIVFRMRTEDDNDNRYMLMLIKFIMTDD